MTTTQKELAIEDADTYYIKKYSGIDQTMNGNLTLSTITNRACCFMVANYGAVSVKGVVSYNATITNSNFGVNINLATGVAVVSRAGYWLISFQSFSNNTAGVNTNQVLIQKNTSTTINRQYTDEGNNAWFEGGLNMTCIEQLDVNDDIRILCNIGDLHANSNTYFSMSLLF